MYNTFTLGESILKWFQANTYTMVNNYLFVLTFFIIEYVFLEYYAVHDNSQITSYSCMKWVKSNNFQYVFEQLPIQITKLSKKCTWRKHISLEH